MKFLRWDNELYVTSWWGEKFYSFNKMLSELAQINIVTGEFVCKWRVKKWSRLQDTTGLNVFPKNYQL
jgi:hypothetical protein